MREGKLGRMHDFARFTLAGIRLFNGVAALFVPATLAAGRGKTQPFGLLNFVGYPVFKGRKGPSPIDRQTRPSRPRKG